MFDDLTWLHDDLHVFVYDFTIILLYFIYRHAVRRFVFENHGLMKRMYGDQRHISVLRADMDTNDIEGGVWNRRREESSLNRYDSQPSPPPPSPPPSPQSPMTNSTTTIITTSTTTTTRSLTNLTTVADDAIMQPTTMANEENTTDDDDVDADDLLETTTESMSSTQRADQVEQPGFFKESTSTADNSQKSKGM